MKLGFSSYCFSDRMKPGSMDMDEAIPWIAKTGATHIELATLSFSPPGHDVWWTFEDSPGLLPKLEALVVENGLEISGICIPANFLIGGAEDFRGQIDRVKHYVDLCGRLGVRFLRHDVTEWARRPADMADIESNLPTIVDACREVADYAAPRGVVTSIENHGFFMNGSERVRRLLHLVDRPNFKTTIDVGNFLCVDENPLIATRNCLPMASFIHLKDFYVRTNGRPGDGWLETTGGQYLLGSITGFGDMNLPGILQAIVDSGYDGFVSFEFEGNEDRLFANRTSLGNVQRMLASLAQVTA